MNTYYWMFKPEEDGSSRIDILVETTDRAPLDPVPEIIDVIFFGEEESVIHSMRSSDLLPTTMPENNG